MTWEVDRLLHSISVNHVMHNDLWSDELDPCPSTLCEAIGRAMLSVYRSQFLSKGLS